MHALDKLFLKSQPLADRWRAVYHCKQAAGQKMSQLITEKENERFAGNTADMTQDDFFVIAILEMCTDPELSKRFHEVKTDELTWERLRDVAETYQRATASDARAMMVNPHNRFGKKNQSTGIKTCYRCNKQGHNFQGMQNRQGEALLQALQGKMTCIRRLQEAKSKKQR